MFQELSIGLLLLLRRDIWVKEVLNETKIEAILEMIGIGECFEVILSGEEVQRGKPYPDIFLKTAEMLKVNTQECVVIEDSTNGVKAALSAGMKCIGFANLNSGLQDLSSASTIVDNICKINCDFVTSIM